MKTKTHLILVILILYGMVTAAGSLHANTNVAVKDIEYLSGDDFVQLHFKIGQMIPIPDVFYPDKDNNTHIVMRMNDVKVQIPKDRFTFDSSVIDHIKIKRKSTFTDVEILLKRQVNYRVFTNRKGLYIEFPNIKQQARDTRTTLARKQPMPVMPTSKPTKPTVTPAKKKKTRKSAVKPSVTHLPPDPALSRSRQPEKTVNTGGSAVLDDIVVSRKKPGSITFKVKMNGQPEYKVIPIPDSPVRLAIDFKNTSCRGISLPVNHLNVKKIRGGYNSPSVYRVVFDLHYLKNYKVSPSPGNSNMLEIEFFDRVSASRQTPPKKKTGKKVMAKANPNPVKPAVKKRPKLKPVEVDEKKPGVNNIKNIGGKVYATPDPADNITTDFKITQQADTIIISNEDFFEDEKSQVVPQEPPKGEDPPKTTAGPRGMQFVKKTIDVGDRVYSGTRMSFNFHDADLKDVIKIIAKIAGKNIVLDPGISGRVTSQLNDVPWDQALELFLKINGLDQVEEGNIVRIGEVNKLASEAEQRRKLREARQMESDLSVITRTLSFAKVAEVAPLLKKQMSPRGNIMEDARSNTLIITEVPSKIEVLERLIDTLDTANPQVSIEARIIETQATHTESLGIQWGYNFIADSAYGNQTTLKFPNNVSVAGNQFTSTTSPLLGPLGGYAVNLPATGASSGTTFSIGNIANTARLDIALSAMQTKGTGRIISAPKTTTQNNQEANIMQGKLVPIQTIQNNTVTVVYRPAALELRVTPQITADGTIICTLSIDNNSPDFANLVNGIPPITTQSIQTTVMAEDGTTIVIGGLYRVENSSTRDGVPFFSKLPILGSLFRNKNKFGEQKELLIFITPRIVK